MTEPSNPLAKIATALNKAQGVMRGAKKSSTNPFYKQKYSDLASVFDAIREPFFDNGLSVTQPMDVTADGKMILCTRLMHVSGEFIESKMLIPLEMNPQKLGALITYLRRYSLMAIAGLPAEDDDGNQASGRVAPRANFITAEQVARLEELINGHTDIRQKVLENCGGDLGSITVDRYPGALAWVTDLLKDTAK